MTQVRCPGCQTRITVKPELSGRKAKCRCGKVMRMPVVGEEVMPVATLAQAPPPIQFQCQSCFSSLQVKAELAGKSARCKCGSVVKIPMNPLPVAMEPDPFMDDDLFGDPANYGTPIASGQQYGQQPSNYLQPAPRPRPKKRRSAKRKPKKQSSGMDSEMIGGILAMVGAVVWFVGGLAVGYIFFYPPILFFIGLASFIKGALDGD